MIDSAWSAFSNLVVGVAFDEQTLPLVDFAASLAARTGKRLHLVHVVERWHPYIPDELLGSKSPLWDATRAVETSTVDVARRRLEDLGESLPSGIRATAHVAVGQPAEQLVKIAADLDACLLLVGANLGSRSDAPSTLSTTMTLLAECPVPLFAADMRKTPPLKDGPIKMILSDDLTNDTESAAAFAFSLAAALGETWVHQVHVNPIDLNALESALVSASAASHAPLDSHSTASDVFAAMIGVQREKMDARTAPHRDYIEESGGKLTQEVATGPVKVELAGVIAAMHPDVLVFGRHRRVHRRPFFFGRMPIRSMLQHRLPIIVVPELSDDA